MPVVLLETCLGLEATSVLTRKVLPRKTTCGSQRTCRSSTRAESVFDGTGKVTQKLALQSQSHQVASDGTDWRGLVKAETRPCEYGQVGEASRSFSSFRFLEVLCAWRHWRLRLEARCHMAMALQRTDAESHGHQRTNMHHRSLILLAKGCKAGRIRSELVNKQRLISATDKLRWRRRGCRAAAHHSGAAPQPNRLQFGCFSESNSPSPSRMRSSAMLRAT